MVGGVCLWQSRVDGCHGRQGTNMQVGGWMGIAVVCDGYTNRLLARLGMLEIQVDLAWAVISLGITLYFRWDRWRRHIHSMSLG